MPSPSLSECVGGSPASGEQEAVANLRGLGVVLLPPRRLALLAWRPLQLEWPARRLGLVLLDAELVVVEDAEGLDHVGDCDPLIPDQQQVLPVVDVSGARE